MEVGTTLLPPNGAHSQLSTSLLIGFFSSDFQAKCHARVAGAEINGTNNLSGFIRLWYQVRRGGLFIGVPYEYSHVILVCVHLLMFSTDRAMTKEHLQIFTDGCHAYEENRIRCRIVLFFCDRILLCLRQARFSSTPAHQV